MFLRTLVTPAVVPTRTSAFRLLSTHINSGNSLFPADTNILCLSHKCTHPQHPHCQPATPRNPDPLPRASQPTRPNTSTFASIKQQPMTIQATPFCASSTPDRKSCTSKLHPKTADPQAVDPQAADPQAADKSFYRRELPDELISFTSNTGRKLFKESLNKGYAEGYFNLAGNFTVQSEPAYCGPSSLAMVLNALEVDPGRTWKGVWRWYSDELLESCRTETELKTSGITFDQFICLARSHAQVIAKRGNEVSREEFLRDIKYVTQRDDMFMVLSFSRKVLGQTGDGHFSPIGAYHPETNQALVLDSARYKYPCWFADVDKLYDSLQPADIETGRPRGYFLISRIGHADMVADQAQLAPQSAKIQSDVVDLPERPLDVFPTKLSCGKGSSCCSTGAK